jgi:hypothetical protein
MLSSYYRDIQFFRYDPISKLVYIIAGANDQDEIEVFIPPSGLGRLDEDEAEF